MATAMLDGRHTQNPIKQAEPKVIVPEIIEETRTDSEGKIISLKYHTGKLLGKVIIILCNKFHCSILIE